MSTAPTSKLGASQLREAIESVRRCLIPHGLAEQLDDLTIAGRFPALIAALIVAAAIDDLRREVAE